ncbi:hypothetical protein BI312_10555 [Xanthomonas citri pv. citri]|uniref:Uncharacterized protein n=2 Tax=Xanthomonas citri TaxID=346 RepID=A0AA44Z312_XANCM|nr:hypothetical protein BI314_04320 [Xanthomonas citri pv. citri]ASY83138.1 hypothetical protein CIW71_02850 [Xanthomonas citri pv. malvacearum]AZB52650.1 hypothetical protein BHE84_24765 [Xanthomonas citri pv. glycines str. 8ra]NMI13173.1 hypothetical protein [Xanthomonas citri]QDR46923.1 hypothetical protein FPK90_21615 [Xanthomonas citri pv. glycines]
MSARRGTAHPNAADVNKTGATLADRSRVSILLLMLVSACRRALTGLYASALHASLSKPQRCLSLA